jgi:hypothetical protein
MVGSVDAWSVEPAVNPRLREAKRRRLVRMTKQQIAGRSGPVRQIRYRNEVVSPLALELECGKLLWRAQRAIATVVTSRVYASDLRTTVEEAALEQHQWEIAVALREITELLLDLASSYAGGTAGPMTIAGARFPESRDIARSRRHHRPDTGTRIAGGHRGGATGLGDCPPHGGQQRQVPRPSRTHCSRPACHHANHGPCRARRRDGASSARNSAAGHPGGGSAGSSRVALGPKLTI